MADDSDTQSAAAAEKAYAAAAEAKVQPVTAPVAKAPSAPAPEAPSPAAAGRKPRATAKAKVSAPAEAAPIAPEADPAPVARKRAAARKPAAAKAVKAKPVSRRAAPRKAAKPAKPRVKPAASTPTPDYTIDELKEKIMAAAKKTTPDYAKLFKDVQGKAKAAYAKTGAVAGEAAAFGKGNVEAFVASGKILAAGATALGKDYVAESKGAFETLTGDLKSLAAVKSPTELFQLQGKLARRNFDTAVAFGSKTSESLVKLANEAFAPISNRVSLVVDKVSKAA